MNPHPSNAPAAARGVGTRVWALLERSRVAPHPAPRHSLHGAVGRDAAPAAAEAAEGDVPSARALPDVARDVVRDLVRTPPLASPEGTLRTLAAHLWTTAQRSSPQQPSPEAVGGPSSPWAPP